MQVNIIIFGRLTDIVGSDSIVLTGIADTNGLLKEMNKRFPALADMKYAIAVNKKIITGNINLTEDSTIALLPPFSGG
jgi:molybdopterin synthase sulfur carrier subunit